VDQTRPHDQTPRTAGTRPPFPAELALGNVVRLKEAYLPATLRRRGEPPYEYGIIVEQLHATGGVFVVSLHLYDADGRLYLHEPSRVPVYVDMPANEFLLWKVAAETGYRVVEHDLYPAGRYDFVPLPVPFPCAVCGRPRGWDTPSGVCSSACLARAQGFQAPRPAADGRE